MNIKSLFLSAAVAMGATSATAATLSNVDPVVGGPTIASGGVLNVAPEINNLPIVFFPATAQFNGTALDGTLSTAPTDTLTLSADLLPGGNFFAASLTNGPVLTGTLEDTSDEAGLIRALFRTIGGTAGSDFGDLFVLELTTDPTDVFQIPDGVLDASSPFFGDDVEATVYAVTEIAPIPLPAGVWLLLGGLGTLVAIRRRQTV